MKNFVKTLALVLVLISVLSTAAFAETQLIGIPDDGTNLSRGIKLLETAGLIEVDPEAGYTPELADVTNYIYDIEIMPVQANTLPSTLADFAASTINGTYAIPFGLIPSKDGLIIESQSTEGDNPYVNIIVARTEDIENETYKKIVEAYQTQAVAEYILAEYNEAFFPVFDYDKEAEPAITVDNKDEYLAYKSDKEGKTVVKVGVCGGNNNMWKVVQKNLDDAGANIYIELVEFDAYNLPNEALASGEIDLNNFQHKAYLANDCGANGYDLSVICDTLIAPLTLYSQKFDTVDALKDAAGLK